MKTLKQLAKELDFETDEEVVQYIIDSVANGQRQQAYTLFDSLEYSEMSQVCKIIIVDELVSTIWWCDFMGDYYGWKSGSRR